MSSIEYFGMLRAQTPFMGLGVHTNFRFWRRFTSGFGSVNIFVYICINKITL